jgi:protein SCO1/2
VKDSIYKIAQTSYFSTALEDKSEPDGFIHSGAFLLIDKQGRIRGKYDGTKEADVNQLMKDIQGLKREYEG